MPGQPLIDAFEFAAAGTLQRSVLAWRELPRLGSSVRPEGEGLHYVMSGRRDALGRSWLQFEASGCFGFVCQRCLEPMSQTWRAAWDLELARNQAEVDAAPDDPELPDRILADVPLRVAELVEDEALLSVPFAPRHEDCSVQGLTPQAGEKRVAPFDGLRTMIEATRPGARRRARK
ncbi:MAG TPA: YceD family protein [Burkholderiales bacterium]